MYTGKFGFIFLQSYDHKEILCTNMVEILYQRAAVIQCILNTCPVNIKWHKNYNLSTFKALRFYYEIQLLTTEDIFLSPKLSIQTYWYTDITKPLDS